jgi:hypothetical protein
MYRPSAKWEEIKKTLRERDGDFCSICRGRMSFTGKKTRPISATIDHIIPKSKGGKDGLPNLRLVHSFCNSIKANNDYHPMETKDMYPWHKTKDLQPKPTPKVWLVPEANHDYVTMTKWDTDVGQYRVACYHNRYRTVRYFPNQYEAEQFRLNSPRWETI